MARVVQRFFLAHESPLSGAAGSDACILHDAGTQGYTTFPTWSSLGAGHRPARLPDILGFQRTLPRMFTSAGAGHGGILSGCPAWPVGREWDGYNYIDGTTRRMRYEFEAVFGVTSADFLSWGPAAIGLRTSPSALSVSTGITGIEVFAGDITGDGSLFPNPGFEDGWRTRWRGTLGNAAVEGPAVGSAATLHHIKLIYVDAPESILHLYVDGVLVINSIMPDPHATIGTEYRPAVDGAILTACAVMRIVELDEDDDPLEDDTPREPIVMSDGTSIIDSDNITLVTSGEN